MADTKKETAVAEKAAKTVETTAVAETKKAVKETDKAVKKAADGKLSKIIKWFAGLPKRIAKPFKNMFYELKKVTWPTKQKLINYSIIVLLFMLFMGIVIGLLDMGATGLLKLIAPGTAG